MNKESVYNEDYYKNGRRTGLSGYDDYHWMPTRSISEAVSICERLKFQTVIDYGCALGFMVHALRLLGKEAYGCDVSTYARENALKQVKSFIKHPVDIMKLNKGHVDLIIAKDVLEHMTEEEIDRNLRVIYKACDTLLIVVPLGDDDLFRIREYEIDKTHVTKKDEEWWIGKIRTAGFILDSFSYSLGCVKENWKQFPYGNGFFICKKKGQ